jgi:small subunit ribosomal protein S3
MGQKVHPLGFRLGITQKHKNYWCEKPQISSLWLQDANFIRNYLEKTFFRAGIINVEIQRREIAYPFIMIEICAARPKHFFNPSYFSNKRKKVNWFKALAQIKNNLVKRLKKFYQLRKLPDPGNIHCALYLKSPKKADICAAVLAGKLVNDLQQRKPYRQAMKKIVKEAINAGVKGIKVQLSGRLNGAEIARSEKIRSGPVPLQTLRADIDYSEKSARTTYGLLGVKIWVFHGERLIPITNV